MSLIVLTNGWVQPAEDLAMYAGYVIQISKKQFFDNFARTSLGICPTRLLLLFKRDKNAQSYAETIKYTSYSDTLIHTSA